MHQALESFEPSLVLEHFSNILAIPRRSHEEDGMVAFISQWAKSRGWRWKKDEAKNIVVSVPATIGFDKSAVLCLQAHTDMVCVGNTRWPIDVKVVDGWVRTKDDDQTNGSDNAAGVSMAMAVVEQCTHGPIELLFTSDEEDDFSGCEAFRRDYFEMKSLHLINLDTPHDGRITVASAGFAYLKSTLALHRDLRGTDGKRYTLNIKDMPGGHSGEDVHTNRGNSLKLMGKLLSRLPEGSILDSIVGGQSTNSIPKSCTAVVRVPGAKPDFERVFDVVAAERETLRCPDMKFEITEGGGGDAFPLTSKCQDAVIGLLRTVPSGVVTMSLDLEDLPELSSTPSLIEQTDSNSLLFTHMVRGATEAQIDSLVKKLEQIYTSHGCEVKSGHRGRSWMQNPEHPLVKKTQKAFTETGYPAALSGNHGAIEPGTLCGKPDNSQFDAAVSFGVWIRDEHRETERMSLASLQRTYKALQFLLNDVAWKGL